MSNNIELKIENLPELRRAFRDFPKISGPILQKAIVATQLIFQNNTHKDNPVPYRTGFLLSSFRFRSIPLEARWYPTSRYAVFVNNDDRTGPVNARVKTGAYVTSKSGRQYYRSATASRLVTKPRRSHFMEAIVKKSAPAVNKLFAQAGDLITREIARQTRSI